MEKRKTTTSTEVKARYNAKTYRTYRFTVRYDDPLNERLDGYEGSLAELVRGLLERHFGTKEGR